ncbi:MAG TPA: DUF6165 family protein [Phenylobacterium sp.]|nr:DUF6165 family protein [Phenylobacterium sp.]
MPEAPVSWGELIDKLTILELKSERLTEASALANVRRELAALRKVAGAAADDAGLAALKAALARLNAALWDIENDIRALDAAGDFGPGFVELARAVYRTNDERAAVKRQINLALGSDLVEEKSYRK